MKIEVCTLKVSLGFFINYTYIVFNRESGKCIIIDPAHELKKIEAVLKQESLYPEALLLTHSHLDHINLVHSLVQKYDSRVYINQIEAEYYHYHTRNLIPFDTGERKTEFLIDTIPVTGIHTPGHTMGSTCYLIAGHLFTGDTLFTEGCGICNTKGGDPGAMFESLQYLKAHIPGPTLIMPGHIYSEPLGQRFDEVMKKNIYLFISDKDTFIEFRMRKNIKNILSFNRNG